MRIAILGDTHFGVRGGSEYFLERQIEFFEWFVEYLLAHDIRYVVQLGDLFDNRKLVNLKVLNDVHDKVFSLFDSNDIEFYTLIGNHDTYYKNTNRVNSNSLLTRGFTKIHFINQIVTVEVAGLKIDFFPWLNSGNLEEYQKFTKGKSKVAVGHFAFEGFDMYRGVPARGGMKPSEFSIYDLVLSGHFHTRSSKGNIHYVGTPYELTWNDYDDPKGFHLLDTNSLELEFIENPSRIFHKIILPTEEPLEMLDFDGGIVKIIVQDEYEDLDSDINEIVHRAHEASVIDTKAQSSYNTEDSADLENKSTLDIILESLESDDDDLDLDILKKMVMDLYSEALA